MLRGIGGCAWLWLTEQTTARAIGFAALPLVVLKNWTRLLTQPASKEVRDGTSGWQSGGMNG
jgi:hypothetical protein